MKKKLAKLSLRRKLKQDRKKTNKKKKKQTKSCKDTVVLAEYKMAETQQAWPKNGRQANKTAKRNPATGQNDHFGT